jgi:hypothetical protein
MSSEVCLDIPTKQSGEFVTQPRLSCRVHSSPARVIECVRRRPYIEDVRDKELVERGGRDADEGDLNVARKAVLPSELRYDTARDDSCFFSRKFSDSVAALPPSCRGLVGHDLSNQAKFVESGD